MTYRTYLLLVTTCMMLALPMHLRAASPATDCEWGALEAPLPGVDGKTVCDIANLPAPITNYAETLVNYFIAIIISVGLIAIVIGGYIYMTAGGNATRVGSAKAVIIAALVGILLALTSYTILETIGGNIFFLEPTF